MVAIAEKLDFAVIYGRFGIKDDEFDQLGVMGHRQISAGLGFLEANYGMNPINDNYIIGEKLNVFDEELFPLGSGVADVEDSWDNRRGKVAAFISLAWKVCDAIFTSRVEQERSQRVALAVDKLGSLRVDEVLELEWDEGNIGSKQIEAAMKHVMADRLSESNRGEVTWEELVGYDREVARMKKEDRDAYVAKVNSFVSVCGRSMDAALDRRKREESSQRVASVI